jgi:hypothetical protein
MRVVQGTSLGCELSLLRCKVAPAYEQTLESAVYEARDLDAKEEAEAAKNAELARAVDFQTSLDENRETSRRIE